MKPEHIALHRLASQHLTQPSCQTAGELLTRLGALQAQDYASALWAVGVRLPGATQASIEAAIAERQIVRTWPMRGTLHFVPAADVRWMLALLTPRIIAGSTRRWRELALSEAVFERCRQILARALKNETALTRPAVLAELERHGVAMDPSRGYHVLWRLAQEQFLCGGPRRGKEPTFVLLEEWVKQPRQLAREAALVELARRYFVSHGPATLRDFVWWTGLRAADARLGLEGAAPALAKATFDGVDYWFSAERAPSERKRGAAELLPAFDELLLGYTQRSASLHPDHAPKIVPGHNGVFLPTVMIDGRVVGTWKRAVRKSGVVLEARLFESLSLVQQKKLARAAERYGKFVQLPVTLSVA